VRDKSRVGLLLPMFLATCVLVSVASRFVREEFTVDRCLSAHHGSFNYSNMTCDLETNHPYVSYQTRHPRDETYFLFSFVSAIAFLLIYSYTRTVRRKDR
jgi:hypothetical protein